MLIKSQFAELKSCLLFLLFFTNMNIYGQNLPQEAINKSLANIIFAKQTDHLSQLPNERSDNYLGVLPHLKNSNSKISEIKERIASGEFSSLTDTVYVGDVPGDTLIISGSYFNNGPILVFNDGVLIFENANATILGDIFVFQDGKLFGDSSVLIFPQLYFYQRQIIAANNAQIFISNTTLDYSGLSHSLAVVDFAEVNFFNINNIGFTTAGGYGHASISIDGTNQAGEFIMTDSANFSFLNANTVLLWHHVPVNGVLDISFPNGSSVAGYTFNNTTPGVSGIGYNVSMNNCTDVMWSLMPGRGSDVTISSSDIRAIGLWFEGSDTISVSGLVNNSNYTAFTAQLPDRNLQLNSSTLQTWSLYAFDTAQVNVTGCIVGEVGSLGKSFVTAQGILCDGTGGYYWASDTTLSLAISCTVLGYARSERNGIFLLGYGSSTAGASATGNSVMIVTQSSLPQDPVAYEHGVAWRVHIDPPQNLYVDSTVTISGSAWIDEGPLGSFMDFGHYTVEYRPAASTAWIPVTGQVSNEVHNNQLAIWDTQGLLPGSYHLRLNTQNDLGDSIDAVIQVTLLPTIVGEQELQSSNEHLVHIYFDESSENIIVEFQSPVTDQGEIDIVDNSGRKMHQSTIEAYCGLKKIMIPVANYASGVYVLRLNFNNKILSQKVLKSK